MKNGYDFYLKDCLLPVSPEKLQIKVNNANKTLILMNEGEINFLRTAKLSDIEFECILPQMKYPFAVYKDGFKGAEYFLDFFEQLKSEKKPFQFIVSRVLPNGKVLFSTNMTVSMESYTITEQAKDGFDVRVKIKLKQYREYETKTVNIKISGAAAKPTAVVETPRAPSTVRAETPIGIGSEVIVNGRLHGSSYGEAPGQTRTNYHGKVKYINLKGTHPYAIATLSGGDLGWVTKDSVKGV